MEPANKYYSTRDMEYNPKLIFSIMHDDTASTQQKQKNF